MDNVSSKKELIKERLSTIDNASLIGYTIGLAIGNRKEEDQFELVIRHLKDYLKDNPAVMQLILGEELVAMIHQYKTTDSI
ncbi:hypothetical protein [Parasediminibacterium sp. JCM 36343]|uniref:hypothetical protein n=1 Tax=Parasediminibacterium sp. JCM 36343 TaxID=3374279 RepID=UPI0039797039